MARLNNTKEAIPFIATAIWFSLITINVSRDLGLIYVALFTLFPMIIYKWDSIRTTPLDRTGKWLVPAIFGLIMYGVFAIIASVLLPYFQQVPIGQLLNLLASSSPPLAGSKILNTITFVIFVPFAETITFVIIMDLIATKWNIDITKRGLFKFATIALVTGLSFIFLLFHIQAKGITNNGVLLLVFLMMFLSLMATIYFGESKQAIFFHMIANAFGVGIFTTGGVVSLAIPLILIPTFSQINKKIQK